MVEWSEFIVYVDECGTPVTYKPDRDFPIFSLQFVLVRKVDYSRKIVPDFLDFKFKHHGSETVVLHGRSIDVKIGDFAHLQAPDEFARYVRDLDSIIGNSNVRLYSAFFKHLEVAPLGAITAHPYAYFMHVLLREIENEIAVSGVITRCRVVVESRKSSDAEMEAAYEAYKDLFPSNWVDFELEFAEKSQNIIGLQLADLVAKPVAKFCLDNSKPGKEWSSVSSKVAKIIDLSDQVPFRLGGRVLS